MHKLVKINTTDNGDSDGDCVELPNSSDVRRLKEEIVFLRRKMKSLETSLQTRIAQAVNKKKSDEERVEDIRQLSTLLKAAHNAKLEAMEYSQGSKVELIDELRRLHSLLQEAAADKEEQERKIEGLTLKVERLGTEKELLERKLRYNRKSFEERLRSEQKKYSRKLHTFVRAYDEYKE